MSDRVIDRIDPVSDDDEHDVSARGGARPRRWLGIMDGFAGVAAGQGWPGCDSSVRRD